MLYEDVESPITVFDMGRIVLNERVLINPAESEGLLYKMMLFAVTRPNVSSVSVNSDCNFEDRNFVFKTGFNENDNNKEYWPIPNVIGLIKTNHK